MELEDGYAFRHSPDRAVLLAVAEFVSNERLCCPFLEFGITVERAGGAMWLRITAAGESKQGLGGRDERLGLWDRGNANF